MDVAVLAGGTGGAKLARGLLDVVGASALSVIANTGDDLEIYAAHVSPDPDLVTWWLADLIDERGWGIAGDTFQVMHALRAGGREIWFNLGDRDLAMCLLRTEALRRGARLTEAHAEVCRAVGVEARVLPMADEPVRTRVLTGGEWRAFQEFMILARGSEPEGVELDGVEAARATPEVLAAIAAADAIVIGPSNPIVSIGPILAVPGIREALAAARAPVVAVSPFVDGRAVKGPTEAFCRQAGLPPGPLAVARAYAGLIDGLVSDEPVPDAGVPVQEAPTLMDSAEARRALAEVTLELASELRERPSRARG
ncbi:MAG: 2-phospho-L-lactate transferase [Thermoleophilaceae bacterium]|nr:2-phospho-L-lactate transferase [Thermoleophilaceae bacterium]